jgi:hypothetical protein
LFLTVLLHNSNDSDALLHQCTVTGCAKRLPDVASFTAESAMAIPVSNSRLLPCHECALQPTKHLAGCGKDKARSCNTLSLVNSQE